MYLPTSNLRKEKVVRTYDGRSQYGGSRTTNKSDGKRVTISENIRLEDVQDMKDAIKDLESKTQDLQDMLQKQVIKNQNLEEKVKILHETVMIMTTTMNLEENGGSQYLGSSTLGRNKKKSGRNGITFLSVDDEAGDDDSSHPTCEKGSSLVFISCACRLVFSICFICTSYQEQHEVIGRVQMKVIASTTLLLSVVMMFDKNRKKGCACLVAWLFNLAGAITFFTTKSISVEKTMNVGGYQPSKDVVNYNGVIYAAFALLAFGHLVELLHELAAPRKFREKVFTIIALGSMIIGCALTWLGLLLVYISSSLFIVHACTQYVALFNDIPEETANQDSNKKVRANKEEKPLPDYMLDSYAFMMVSDNVNIWNFGFLVFSIQVGIVITILIDQIFYQKTAILLDVPTGVNILVRFAQFWGLVLTIFWQTDIQTSIRVLDMLWYKGNENWPYEKVYAEDGTFWTWLDKVFFPNMLRLLGGLLVQVVSFVTIVKSDNVVDLFKDYTVLILISDIDNIAFSLANQGYFGFKMKDETDKVKKINMVNDSEFTIFKMPLRLLVVLLILLSTFSGWSFIIYGQISRNFFMVQYPNCNAKYPLQLGNGECNMKEYNIAECDYDGGDCIKFNEKYPLCEVEYPLLIGDGRCHGGKYNTAECDYDEGDCVEFYKKYPDCNVEHPSMIGDGNCDGGEFDSVECDYDGGDCIGDNPTICQVEHRSFIGNGFCDGGAYNTVECAYDGGDCIEFNKQHPNCKVEHPKFIGNGYCNGGVYDTAECDYDGGDCKRYNNA